MTLIELIESSIKSKNGVYYLQEPAHQRFEDIYLKVRKAEGRIYSDSELRLLPDIENPHRYYNEWRVRKHSMKILLDYLKPKANNKSVLEPGCGNGWLSNKLAGLGFSEVIGLDVNVTELEQAVRVFSGKPNLLFIYGNIFNLSLKFDYIVLSSVIAYFKDLNALIDSLLSKLNTNGEIHIIDSPFYKNTAKAHERLIDYYNELGVPAMAEYYHHHTLDDLKKFNYSILHNPRTIINKIKLQLDSSMLPFHWIKIKK